MKRNLLFGLAIWVASIVLIGCRGNKSAQEMVHPDFSADSAYRYIEEQVQFGPRVPNTKAHRECAAYLLHKLRSFGAEVQVQHGRKTNYAGDQTPIINIIGHFAGNPNAEAILLCAHYDSRPWCDEEENYDLRFQAVLGANDGASGVGVLLEIARQIGLKRACDSITRLPIDIVFFDCEDMGTPDFYTGMQRENTWCLGSQFWAEQFAYEKSPSTSDKYEYGILLDMVGDANAVFPKEYYSLQGAGNYVEKIWRNAAKLGYQKHFVSTHSYPLIDDHYYVGSIAGIPCVDIIHYDANSASFPYWWHTTKDNMQHIDKNTLRAVGETVLLCLNY